MEDAGDGEGGSGGDGFGPVEVLASGAGFVYGEHTAAVGAGSSVGAGLLVLAGGELEQVGATALPYQLVHGGYGAGGVLDVDDAVGVLGLDSDGGVGDGGGRAANEQGDVEALPLHLAGDGDHFVQGRSDQAAESDDVGVVFAGGVEYVLEGGHDAEVHYLVVVASEHDADYVLADVVNVALDCGDDDLAVGAGDVGVLSLGLDVGDEFGNGFLHDAGALDDLGQEHAAGSEEVAHDVHAVHERALDDVEGAVGGLTGFLYVGLDV